MAFSSRRLPMKHQGQITSEMTSTDKFITASLVPVEVDPADRDRLRIALEERSRQPHLKVAVFQRDRRSRFAVAADHANVHPERAFCIQRRVFLAILPESHDGLPVLN